MLDPKYVLSNLDLILQVIKERNMEVDLSQLEKIAAERTATLQEQERLNHRRKELAKQHSAATHTEGKQVKERLSVLDERLRELHARYNELLLQIPNLIHPDSPRGTAAADCALISSWGSVPTFDFTPRDHLQLGEALDLFDFERAAEVSGPKFYYLKGAAVLLELALTRYAIDLSLKRGYELYLTPDVARQEVAAALGFNPRGPEGSIYSLADSDLCLIGTSEITLGAYHRNQKIPADQLPLRMVGISHCFRREAGAAGRRDKGLFRVHQFTKVELFVVSQPADAEALHQELLDLECEIFRGLELPFRVLDICSGDLGTPAYRKFDLEAWMPGREGQGGGVVGEWGEVTSTSNCTDYQARRLNVKTVDAAGSPCFAYMLNGTAIATSRAIIALLENHQQRDGSVRIPAALHPYTGFTTIAPAS